MTVSTLIFSFVLTAASVCSVAAQSITLPPGVLATGTQGVTNPPAPTLGTPINQSSVARLLSVNAIDDFCVFAPPTLQNISDSETYEVAWCTKQRNNARVIPDGTIEGVSFLKTAFYVQLIGYGNFTKLNIPAGDYGGELDPHGAYGDGNPIGGNVTSNILGSNMAFAEWMLYIDYNQFCLRVCTNANSTYSAAAMCWHELDEMGCQFVMPGNYNVNGTFETCEADVAYPPGWYPTATVNGTPVFSTFAQRYTGTLSNGQVYTIGDLTTPAGPYSTPSSSNCVRTSSVSNGINLARLGVVTSFSSSATGAAKAIGSTTTSGSGSSATGRSGGSTANQNSNAGVNSQTYPGLTMFALVSGIVAVVFFH